MTKYTFENGQLYAMGPLEIEIVTTCGTGTQARVTFAVFECTENGPRTAQGSATVPASWLTATLQAHRAHILTERTGDNDRAEYPDPIKDWEQWHAGYTQAAHDQAEAAYKRATV